jgi:hypothetical protein
MQYLETNGRGGCSFKGISYEMLKGFVEVPKEAVEVLTGHSGYSLPLGDIPPDVIDAFHPKSAPVEKKTEDNKENNKNQAGTFKTGAKILGKKELKT